MGFCGTSTKEYFFCLLSQTQNKSLVPWVGIFQKLELFIAEKSVGIDLFCSKLESGIKFCALANGMNNIISKQVFILCKIVERSVNDFILKKCRFINPCIFSFVSMRVLAQLFHTLF